MPHVTLKAIANNKEIDAIHAKWQDQHEPLRAKINQAAGKTWEEWQIPREIEGSDDLKSLLQEWWKLRRDRQAEIDASEYMERTPVTQSAGLGAAQSAGLRYEQRVRRVSVSIGPEHGTVGPQQVKEAAKEAVQGIGFDLLVVCGFAFDPHVSEEVKRYGGLTVLPTKMNPDLAMGDELLKKTGAGNLFMVFGEPDVEITKQKDGAIVVEIKGVDVYDPTTGQIRNSSTDDIACWFIDTDYDGESFFVRHAYFTGAEEPYDKLKRALRAEVDEAAWAVLYRTISRPFARPVSGKIAVKVINHYGDEVLKVFGV